MADRQEGRSGGGPGGLSIGLVVVVVGAALSGFILGMLLISHNTHTDVPARCAILQDPIVEQIPCTPCEVDEGDNCHDGAVTPRCASGSEDSFRAKVLVEAAAVRNGWGRSVIVPRAWVYSTGGRDWTEQFTEECKWAAEHCLCPGCNGTDPGACEPDTMWCRPGSEGCERDAPDFECFVDTTTMESHWPNYGIQANKVRFHKEELAEGWGAWLGWTVFFSLLFIGFVVACVAMGAASVFATGGAAETQPLNAQA